MSIIQKRDALLQSLKTQFAQKVASVEYTAASGNYPSLDKFLLDLANNCVYAVHAEEEE